MNAAPRRVCTWWWGGLHGLGAARQYEFERFAYRGRFEKEDYLHQDRRIREADDVKAQLADKRFVKLEPQHLRAALSGVGDDRDVRLGLVPLRDRRQYDRFRFLFCNLLRLALLRQDELKELLVEIYRNEFQQMEIDLSVEYRERFNRLKRDAQAVNDLRWIEKDVARLLEIVASATPRAEPCRSLGGAGADVHGAGSRTQAHRGGKAGETRKTPVARGCAQG